MPLLLIKDLIGYRIATYEDYSDPFFTLDNGDMVPKSEGYIADAFNVEHALAGRKPEEPQNMMYMPLEAPQFIQLLGDKGFGLTEDMRVRPKVGEPFTRLTCKSAVLVIMAHVKVCQDNGHNPEATPIRMAMDPESKQVAICVPMKDEKTMGIIAIPDEVPDMKEEAELGTVNEGRQVCFKWHDWVLIPVNSVVAKLHQFLDVTPINATSIQELEKEYVISDEGILMKSGATKLMFKGISIDDFLKEV